MSGWQICKTARCSRGLAGALRQRRVAYAAVPYQVDTTDKTPEQVAQEVLALWQSAFE
jgi:hypothetical protein